MNKKKTFILVLVAAGLIIFTAEVIGSERIWGITDDTVILKEDLSGEMLPELMTDPVPIYAENIDIDQQSLFDIYSIIDEKELKEKENASVQKVELISYKEYAHFIEEDGGSLTHISPDRLVWYVEIYYPDGFHHHRVGTIENAVARGIYDAETGEYFGQEIVSLNNSV